ncbi:MAG: excinuclease ABC subunit A [Rhodobacteraceae bacterium]|nr:excinuclease ABC subunit A [Paracoccaceae bacterium]
MHRSVFVAALVLALTALPAAAEKAKGNKHGHGGHGNHAAAFCPPGLAKKDPPCLPPGQAKKRDGGHVDDDHVHVYRVGDTIRGDYILIRDPLRYGLEPAGTYWRVGDELFRVDSASGQILTVLGSISNLLN